MTLHERLKAAKVFAFDFETTGLNPYNGAKVFSCAFAWREEGLIKTEFFYGLPSLDLSPFAAIFADADLTACAHNAKFEGRFLRVACIPVHARLWCTEVFARVQYNDHLSYSLANCASRMGLAKEDGVKKYMDSHKLYGKTLRGKKDYHFWKVPRTIIEPYNRLDAELSLRLYEDQRDTFRGWDESADHIYPVVGLELHTTPQLLDMEHRGIRLDISYCNRALAYERKRSAGAKLEFECSAGGALTDSAKALRPIFDRFQLSYGRTDKGNASFREDELKRQSSHPLVRCILEHRDAEKRATTYFENFLNLVSPEGRLHANIRQAGTATGRFSCSDPNVQNFTDDEESKTPYPVRRAFIADPGYKIVSIDFAQMEYRLLMDEAGEDKIIDAILSGLDVHQATADLMGVDRKTAKNCGFALLYGAGSEKLAMMSGVTKQRASEIRDIYFRSLPAVARYTQNLMNYGRVAPYSYNWLGRRYHIPKEYIYKIPNYRIQGGCADIFRQALLNVREVLRGTRSYAMLPIHDELVFSIHESEMHLIPALKEAMISGYSHKRLPMDVSVSIGDNFHDLVEYGLSGEEARNKVLNSSSSGT